MNVVQRPSPEVTSGQPGQAPSPGAWPPRWRPRAIWLARGAAALLVCAVVWFVLFPAGQQQPQVSSTAERSANVHSTDVSRSIAGSQQIDPVDLKAFANSILPAEMARTGAPGAGVVVVENGRVILAQGYGMADRERGVAWDAGETTFLAKSISKLFTVTAVMQMVEQGQLDLDADVNSYLPNWRIANPFPQPIRVRDLLTHTTGIEDRGPGTLTERPEDVLPLDTYLQTRLLAPIFSPGSRISYSDHNTTLAGYLVELRAGMPFAEYMQERVLDPIGMSSSSFAQPRPAALAARMAAGYLLRDGLAQRMYPGQPPSYNVAPAVSLTTTSSDVAQFMIAQLEGGQTQRGRLLGEATVAEMQRQQYSSAAGLPGMAFGFFEAVRNGRRELTHTGGGHGWGHSLVLLPEEHTGVFVAGNLSDDLRVADAFTSGFVDRYFPDFTESSSVQPPREELVVDLRGFAGTFRTYRYDRGGIDKISHVNEVQVQPNGDGTLSLSTVPDARFAPIGPALFQRVGGSDRMAFAIDAQGQASQLFTSNAVFDRLPWYEALAVQITLLVGVVTVFLSVVLASAVELTLGVFRRRGAAHKPPRLTLWARRIGVAGALLDLLFIGILIALVAYAADDFGPLARTLKLAYAESPALLVPAALAWLSAGLTLPVPVLAIWAWKSHAWSWVARVHYTFFALAATSFVWFLSYWNFLGGRI